MVAYLRALPGPRVLLWCYFIWYLFTAIRYFEWNPSLWATSLGMSAIIGTGLYLGTAYVGPERRAVGFWPVFRFYLTPFCVSSFAALVKGRGFVLVFHPTLAANLLALALCAAFCGLVLGARSPRFRYSAAPPSPPSMARRMSGSGASP